MRSASKSPKVVFTPVLRLFLISMILANLGGMIFDPFVSIYLNKLGQPVETIGLFYTISAIFPLIFQILGGWISDRIGRLRSIAWGSLAGAVSWAATIIAPLTSNPLIWFLISNAISSITFSLVAPSFDAFIAEQSDEKSRGHVFGVIQSIYLVVNIVGPPLGGFIAEHFSYQALAWTGAVLYWIATIIRVNMARPEAAEARAKAEQARLAGAVPQQKMNISELAKSFKSLFALFMSGGIFMWIVIIDGVFDIAGKLSGNLFPLFMRQISGQSEARIGFLMSFGSIVTALLMIPLGRFSDKKGERVPIVAGCVLFGAAFGILAFGNSLPILILSALFSGIAQAAIQPSMQSATSKAVPSQLRGLAYGILGTSLGLFSFFAPGIGGWLWHQCFPTLPFLVSGALALAAAVPSFIGLKSLQNKAEADTAVEDTGSNT